MKGKAFDSWRSVGTVQQAVRIHQARQVDELILLDIGATPENRKPDLELIRELTENCFMPLTVGGGIKSIEDIQAVMDAGADKVSICTALFHTDVVEKAAARFGSQAIVAAVDCFNGHVWSECGQQQWPMGPRSFCRLVEDYGAGEILLTAIDREGGMQGYDIALIAEVSDTVGIPVIAHGGCRGYEDMREAITAGASAVAAGALFQFSEMTPRGAAQYLRECGVESRV